MARVPLQARSDFGLYTHACASLATARGSAAAAPRGGKGVGEALGPRFCATAHEVVAGPDAAPSHPDPAAGAQGRAG